MTKINLESIQQELTPSNWSVISTEYVNLKTEMQFKCPEGHIVFSTWDKMRAKPSCPICEKNHFKDIKPIIAPKIGGAQRVLALDQASHITGWSIFDDKKLVSYGTYTAKASDEMERMHEVNMWFISMLQNWQPDLVGLEGIQYQEKSGVTTFQTLARLQGILMETCTQADITFKICPTNTWRSHCGVKGQSRADKKKSMQLLVKKWFDISVSDDCADAIGIGKYVSETYQSQIEIINWE